MSLTNAMLAGVTGLQANSAALAATSDNIANVNTVGYKDDINQFEDLVTSATSTDYSGGVTANITQDVTQQGVLQTASAPTDLALTGNGFFVTTQQVGSPSATNTALLTRAGAFTVDSQGYLQNSAGLYLEGWLADDNGNVTTDASNQSLLQSINIQNIAGTAAATTAATVTGNLDADGAINAAVSGGTYSPTSTTTSMAVYDATTGVGTKPDFQLQIPVSDSEGGEHTIQLDFLKSTTANQWDVEAIAVPASDVNSGTGVPGLIASGTLAFTSTGAVDPTNTTFPTSLTIGASGSTPPATGASWATSLGVNGQSVAVNLAGTMTQFASESTEQGLTTNGTPFGSVSSVSIDSAGNVTANFSNGTTRKIAQVAIAVVPNEDGLTAVNGDAYQVSQSSGAMLLQTAGTNGAGNISSSELESSTVDLSTEFANLITTQRAYSASSKIITTADEMLQDLIQIIR